MWPRSSRNPISARHQVCSQTMSTPGSPQHEFTSARAESIVRVVAPDHRLVTVSPASGSFTNDVRILECRTRAGNHLRLVVKFMVDQPEYASRCATAQFRALTLVRAHGVPAPEPIFLDETGEVLGVPVDVNRFVEGRQVANPRDPVEWAEALAQMLLRVHDSRPSDRDRGQTSSTPTSRCCSSCEEYGLG